MPSQLERAARTLDVTTSKPPADALSSARQAIESLGSVGSTRIRIDQTTPDGFSVALKPTVIGMAHGPGHFDVYVDRALDESGGTDVHVEFVRPVVTQSKLLGLIPMGPKTVMGLTAYERSVEAIEQSLKG